MCETYFTLFLGRPVLGQVVGLSTTMTLALPTTFLWSTFEAGRGGMSHYKEIVKHFLEISNTFVELLIGLIKIIFDYEDLYHVHVSPVFGSQH